MPRARPALLFWLLAACIDPERPLPVGIPAPSPTQVSPGTSATVPVVFVTDGDTFTVRRNGDEVRVRLIGIDAPEVAWYGGAAECFGPEAARYLRRELTGRRVRLEGDVERRDPNGRALAYAYIGSRMVNRTLVHRGYAESRLYAPNDRYQHLLDDAEARAIATGAGMWSACG